MPDNQNTQKEKSHVSFSTIILVIGVLAAIGSSLTIERKSATSHQADAAIVSTDKDRTQDPLDAAPASTPDWPPGSEEHKHLLAAFEWLNAAAKVAIQTEDSQAHLVVEFLRGKIAIMEPMESRGGQTVSKLLWHAKGPTLTLIVPLLAGDEKRGGDWSRIGTAEAVGASYNPEHSVITLRSEPFSVAMKGILLLHEAEHARAYTHEQYDWKDTEVFCEKERDTHAFENRLLSKLGGNLYATALDRELARLRNVVTKNHLDINRSFPKRGPYDTTLDAAFGEAQSERERDFRQTQVWVHAIFRWIDEDHPGSKEDKEDKKARFLKVVYQRDGILPDKDHDKDAGHI